MIQGDHLEKDFANFFGAISIGAVNKLSNKLTGFKRWEDIRFQKSKHVYPGDGLCNIEQPHSKWHEIAANVLVDIALAADLVGRYISGKHAHDHVPLLQRYSLEETFSSFDWTALSPNLSKNFDTCIKQTLAGWPKPIFGAFVGCMASTTVFTGSMKSTDQNGRLLDDTAPETLEMCLAMNDCLRFDGFQIDTHRLPECLGLSSNVSRGVCRGKSHLCCLFSH